MHDLPALLGPARTAAIVELTVRASPRTVSRWLSDGRLVRLFPGWVTLPELADEWEARAHAATGYTGGPLSHLSALAAHRAVDFEPTLLHVTVPTSRRVRSSTWLRVHRSTQPPPAVRVRGLAATALPRSLVDAWGQAHRSAAMNGVGSVVRGAALRAVRDRRATSAQLRGELDRRPELPGRAALAELLRLIDGGRRSEREIFGVRHVLAIPGLPACTQQHRVVLPDGPVLLDAAWPEVRLAVELDGAAFHGSREARERDLRRDAALAAQGWLVLRFSYRRLTQDPAACRRQIAAVYRGRPGVVP